ncbi:GSCFA family protein [Promicromonospora umidemergens]|uniref:GSCFA domain-containing protein n=1 Tax=Promicromonospora umidemergens TaxID=629679 RepID=A0ABP8WMK9_9MICO|nr:GSCFA domain-containing protein [Promicromonospora umidemergens]MCP2283149.1 GSCFA family protein [Promicromonospora umidemergens]
MHPYQDLPSRAFWKQAVAQRNAMELADVYTPRFEIARSTRITAAGSCFAQHIGKQFKTRGYGFIDVEPAPPALPAEARGKFGFGIYSARYGNIYSARQLVQTFARARGEHTPVDEYWTDGERFYDPYRPSIEPRGYASLAELRIHRDAHLKAVSSLLAQTDLFVFTFGLTEAWENIEDGTIYPTCPGTVHGEFDEAKHRFINFTFRQVLEDFESFIAYARSINPAMRFLVTVSPVPLTATASGHHVLPATVASKSILRAVCGELYDTYDYVDYFPSYELVSSHPMRALAYEPNLRSVSAAGVAQVMDVFFSAHGDAGEPEPVREADAAAAPATPEQTADDVVCDELILETFGR